MTLLCRMLSLGGNWKKGKLELYYLCKFSINVILFQSKRAVKITRSSFKTNVFYDSSEPLRWELENKNYQEFLSEF